MKISESNLQLFSSHRTVEFSEKRESLTLWQGSNQTLTSADNQANNSQNLLVDGLQALTDQLSLSNDAQRLQSTTAVREFELPLDDVEKMELAILSKLFEIMFGVSIDFLSERSRGSLDR